MTPYQQHCQKWKDGCGSSICSKGSRLCFARGSIPADVLFCGEGPGVSEDAIGQPFIGPAGRLLDSIIYQAWRCDPDIQGYSYCMTNLVLCFPREAKAEGINEPPQDAIKACAPRLREFVGICKPKLVVCVGSLADKHAPVALKGVTIYAGGKVEGHPTIQRWTSIVHPASILRMNQAQQGLAIQRAVVILSNALEYLV